MAKKDEGNAALGCLALVILSIALALIILAIVWGACTIFYLITFIIAGFIFRLYSIDNKNNAQNKKFVFEDFATHSAFISGIFALLPTIILILNNIDTDIIIPSNIETWSINFYAVNWFSFISGSIYGLIICISLAFINIVNKSINCFSEKQKCVYSYILAIIQLATAVFVIKSSIDEGYLSNTHLLLATLPILLLSLGFIILTLVINRIKKFFKTDIKKDSCYKKADKLFDEQNYNEAIEYYKKAQEFDEFHPYSYYAIGLCQIELNEYDEAKQNLLKAISLNENQIEFYYAIADVCFRLNDYESGLDYIDKLSGKLDKKSKKYKEYEKFREDYINKKEERIAELEKEKREKEIKNLVNDAMAYKERGRYNCALEQIKNAVELAPDIKDYKNLMSEIQKLLEKENEKIEELYNEARDLSASKDYKKAIAKINIAVNISNKQEISTSKLTRLKNKIQSMVDTYNIAKEKYNAGMKAYKEKDFINAINNLEWAISLDDENSLYKKDLENIKRDFEDRKQFGKELYDKAVEYFNNNDFTNAILNINKAMDYINDNSYKKLKSKIETLQKQYQDKKEAEKLYENALDMYNSNDLRFDLIIEKINSAIKKNNESKYSDLLKKVEKAKAEVEADNYYKKAKKEYENKNYESAISSIKEAVKLVSSNRIYIDFKQKLDWEYKEYKNDKEALDYCNEGVKALNNANFKDAISFMEKALKLKPNNEEWQNLLEKAKTGKIDITTCTKKALFTLDFLDNEKIEQIIKARNEGNMWYDYRNFCETFELNEPHQMIGSEEKILFPLKQGNKYGRRIDA